MTVIEVPAERASKWSGSPVTTTAFPRLAATATTVASTSRRARVRGNGLPDLSRWCHT